MFGGVRVVLRFCVVGLVLMSSGFRKVKLSSRLSRLRLMWWLLLRVERVILGDFLD